MILLHTFLFLSTLVYRYDFTPLISNPMWGDASGYIEMRQASGEMDPLEAIYDFSVTGVARNFPGLPSIPAITFSLASALPGYGESIEWNETRIGFNGNWGFTSQHLDLDFPLPDFGQHYAQTFFGASSIVTTWPYDYVDTQPRTIGTWLFSGTRNVPEAGGTLALLALGSILIETLRRRL
jgi:hypothetical protein